jgi:putative peptidoglycan lipid II flippase
MGVTKEERPDQTTAEKGKDDGTRSISRAAFKVSAGGIFSLVAGLASQGFIAYLFGAGAEMDAFLTAVAVPVYFQTVLITGLSFVFVPAFIENRTQGKEDEAWALAGTFIWITVSILMVLATAVSVFAPQITALIAPGLTSDKASLAANMLSILIFAVPLTGLGSLTVGVQNARNRFFWPAMGGALNSLGNIVSLFALYQVFGPIALAWSYLFAVAMQVSVTAVPVFRHGWNYRIPLKDERVRNMTKLVLPFILFGILTKATPVLQRFFASGLPDGDLSYLGYADKVARIFDTLVASSIATAIFPVMSKTFSKDGQEGLSRVLKHGLKMTVAIGAPLVAILSAIAIPFIETLFERGAFAHESTLQVARIVPIVLMGSIIFSMFGNLLARVFYVTKDTRTVPMIGAISSVIYIFLAYFLVNIWGYVGLATARTVFRAFGAVVLFLLLMGKLRLFDPGTMLKIGFKYTFPSVVSFALAWGLMQLLINQSPWIQMIVAGGIAGLFYLIILFQVDAVMARTILELAGIQRLIKIPLVQRVMNFMPIRFQRFAEEKLF